MRRFFLVILAVSMLCGCTKKQGSDASAVQTAYESYYQAVEENGRFQNTSLYYDISAEMTALPDGTHSYYIFLDNARIAMYDVVLLAVEGDQLYADTGKMMPSIGIFDNTDVNLVPFQSNPAAGYARGLMISGNCAADEVELKILVEWKDKTREKTTREFLSLVLNMNGVSYPDRALEEGGTE